MGIPRDDRTHSHATAACSDIATQASRTIANKLVLAIVDASPAIAGGATPVDPAGGYCYRTAIKPCKSLVGLSTKAYGSVTRSQPNLGTRITSGN